MKPTLLLVSHEASRTGAPKVARHLLDELGGEWSTVLVHRWGGPMRPELDAAADRSFLEPMAHVRVTLRRRPATKRFASVVERWAIRRTLRREKPDVVWCNTVMTSRYVVEAEAMGIPVVLHSHEQQDLVGTALRRTGVDGPAVARSPLLTPVGCATDTSAALAVELGAPVDAVRVLQSPIDVAEVRSRVAPAALPTGPVALACGVGDHRKGIDVFNAAAELSTARGDGISWVWVGRVDEGDRTDAVTYPGEQPTAVPFLAGADVVVLPSRGDPFPLVVLEAMALARPVVASDLPGPREQLGDAGTFVPPADAAALADAVRDLLAAPDRAAALGEAGSERCAERWDVGPFGASARSIAADAAGAAGASS